jgi:hypothetical protein
MRNLKELPLTDAALASRAAFSRYIYNLHEKVNAMLGKTSGLTYDDVRNRYEQFRARCSSGAKPAIKESTKEKRGCLDPVTGVDTKCIMKIVPLTNDSPSLSVDPKCVI